MNKNINSMNDIINDITEKFGDGNVQMSFRDVMEGIDRYFTLILMSSELVKLIREEEDLRKHHRAYLHVREQILECSNKVLEYINAALMEQSGEKSFCYVPKSECSGSYPFAEAESDEDEDTVTIPKKKYEDMIDDLLTMAELVDMVSDIRTKDAHIIQDIARLIPTYGEYEKNRISLYRDAAKEAEAIFDRWQDELDEDYEPDEFFSD